MPSAVHLATCSSTLPPTSSSITAGDIDSPADAGRIAMAGAPANPEIATRFSSGKVPGVRVSRCMPRPSTSRRVTWLHVPYDQLRAQAEQRRFRVTCRARHHDVVDDPRLNVRVVRHAAVLGHPGVARDADRTAVGRPWRTRPVGRCGWHGGHGRCVRRPAGEAPVARSSASSRSSGSFHEVTMPTVGDRVSPDRERRDSVRRCGGVAAAE